MKKGNRNFFGASVIPVQFQGHALMFSDGACSGNPGPGGWGAICVTPRGEVQEIAGSERSTTNNRMELRGAIEGIRRLADTHAPLQAFTDSTYVIRGIRQWVHGWRRNGWKTAEGKDVLNRDLWEELIRVVQAHGHPVAWNYVAGHAGIPSNERVDEIAVAMSRGEKPFLFQGSISGYSVKIGILPSSFDLPEAKKRSGSAVKAFYLSLVDGKLERHVTWPECEARVKGRSGAKYKKVASEAEAMDIAESWGVRYTDLV